MQDLVVLHGQLDSISADIAIGELFKVQVKGTRAKKEEMRQNSLTLSLPYSPVAHAFSMGHRRVRQ